MRSKNCSSVIFSAGWATRMAACVGRFSPEHWAPRPNPSFSKPQQNVPPSHVCLYSFFRGSLDRDARRCGNPHSSVVEDSRQDSFTFGGFHSQDAGDLCLRLAGVEQGDAPLVAVQPPFSVAVAKTSGGDGRLPEHLGRRHRCWRITTEAKGLRLEEESVICFVPPGPAPSSPTGSRRDESHRLPRQGRRPSACRRADSKLVCR
jgi:hypothetical protein